MLGCTVLGEETNLEVPETAAAPTAPEAEPDACDITEDIEADGIVDMDIIEDEDIIAAEDAEASAVMLLRFLSFWWRLIRLLTTSPLRWKAIQLRHRYKRYLNRVLGQMSTELYE
jgi:hypothetical protein